jgi:NO-binding membrane sensor protein with MHYT domain
MLDGTGHVHHFAHGAWLLLFAFAVSVVGCVVGLACTLRARRGGGRTGWLVLAAVSIGGVGVWLTHFIAMFGFDTPGMPVRYDVGRTSLSAVLSVGVVFLGLLVFGVRTRFAVWRLLLGGLTMGLGVSIMHYTGMWAVRIQGRIGYDTGTVWLSVAFAVVAATMALLFTVLFDSVALRAMAGVIMGFAVIGTHYTGMAAVVVRTDPAAPAPAGVEVFMLLSLVFVPAVAALTVPACAVLLATTWSESERQRHMRLRARPAPSRPEPWSVRHGAHTVTRVRGVGQFARQPTIPVQHWPHDQHPAPPA